MKIMLFVTGLIVSSVALSQGMQFTKALDCNNACVEPGKGSYPDCSGKCVKPCDNNNITKSAKKFLIRK